MTLPTSTPSAQGINPARLVAFLDAIEADPVIEPHGLIIHRHGHRVLEAYWAPHRAEQIRLCYSLSKSFTGAALGLAVGDGLLSLDDLVVDHLPEKADGVDDRTARMAIRHIASMASGHQDETLLDALVADPHDLVRAFLHLPPQHEPGTWFAYNQTPVLALATIVQRLTGERLVDQLRRRVLDPIGVGDLRWYQYQPGIDLGFSGVFTDLDAIARFAQLHLDGGIWEGRQVLPSGWVEEASSVQIENRHRPEPDWSQGYGFQLWRNQHGYRGDGAYGQYMVVLPEQDAVVAFFSHTEPMQTFMDLMWEHLLPALDAGSEPDPSGDQAVIDRTTGLRIRTAADRTGSPLAPTGATPGRFVRVEDGTASHFSITEVEVGDGHVSIHEGETSIRVPLTSSWTDVPDHPIATSAATDDAGRLVVDLVMLASPHRLELTTDPATSTFAATWPIFPLFGMGLDHVLSRMRPPEG
ncbi:serine hydrolase domain-containing protein [Dermatobacter hominis]|uniref:serine hydrolase domain-containing protein n=1 Tax=Dermatobacter hominis TaxID=2884263 RepID=UPI001D1230EC|nr:serine hydrolase domain-containing protein [Dermatobacter hominis]UDY34516.1 beta-lactamase family protein [Dermatobacter hominis]